MARAVTRAARWLVLLCHSPQSLTWAIVAAAAVSQIDFGIYIDVLQIASDFSQKQEILDLFSSVLYECVTQETPEMLPAYVAMDQVWFQKPIPVLRSVSCISVTPSTAT